MDLEVVGRHALFFDDDAMAAFVNAGDALVEWNSLQIDRYDVRHLLSSPPRPRRRSHPSNLLDSSIQLELDHERYLDLPPPFDEPEVEEGEKSVDAGSYRAVGFSYGSADDSADRKSPEVGLESSEFRPSFTVPASLLHCLPPTEKVHQIIARTALFVSNHGGQSEIVLRVRQGNNPTFGFLMPDHELHAYFRFLVDRPELLQSYSDFKAQNEGKKASDEQKKHDGVGGALSLLGSVYGSVEDEDPANGYDTGSKVLSEAFDVLDTTNVSCPFERAESSSKACEKDEREKNEKVSTHSLGSSKDKEKGPNVKKNNLINASKSGSRSSMQKQDDFGSSAASEKTKAEVSGLGAVSKIGPFVEPSSDLKRLIDKIVEFILKNGKQFESTLMEQDSKHGRFPFLLPFNQYHPYYLKVLQKAQESKVHGPEKRASVEESDSSSLRSAGYDLPYVFDKKEKFKMVIGKSKKDSQDSLSRTSQQEVGVNVDAAAAILQAATRGIKNPNLSIISDSSKNGDSRGHSSEDGQASSFFNGPPPWPGIICQKSDQRMEHTLSIPKAKEIAKSAAAEAASEADSSEARLSKEQKLKAERLRRAKMFVALLKSGAAPVNRDSSRGESVEPQESALSRSGTEVNVTKEREGSAAPSELTAVEREGSSAPLNIGMSNENDRSEMRHIAEEHERRARRKYRSRSGRHEEEDEEEDKEEEGEGEEQQQQCSRKKHRSSREDEDEESGEVRDDKRSKKKRRSCRHTYEDGGDNADDDEDGGDNRRSRNKHRHSSPEYDDDDERRDAKRRHEQGRKKHSSRRSSRGNRKDDSDGDYKHSKKKHRSHRTSHRSKDGHEHRKKHSSDDESDRSHRTSHRSRDRHEQRTKHSSGGESHREHKRANCSNDEEQQYGRADKNENGTKEREELEEGEIRIKVSDQSRGSTGGSVSREASVDVSGSHQRALSQPSDATEISDDLRAKIRAMLMATRM